MKEMNQATKYQKRAKTGISTIVDRVEAECIERKVEKALKGKEAVSFDRIPIYQKRCEGIDPQYNIKTDKMELLREAVESSTTKYFEARQMRQDARRAEEGGGAPSTTEN